jgi:hypothetical protein
MTRTLAIRKRTTAMPRPAATATRRSFDRSSSTSWIRLSACMIAFIAQVMSQTTSAVARAISEVESPPKIFCTVKSTPSKTGSVK